MIFTNSPSNYPTLIALCRLAPYWFRLKMWPFSDETGLSAPHEMLAKTAGHSKQQTAIQLSSRTHITASRRRACSLQYTEGSVQGTLPHQSWHELPLAL